MLVNEQLVGVALALVLCADYGPDVPIRSRSITNHLRRLHVGGALQLPWQANQHP